MSTSQYVIQKVFLRKKTFEKKFPNNGNIYEKKGKKIDTKITIHANIDFL